MPIAIEKLEAMAPDQASLLAAVKIKPSAWQVSGIDSTREFAWGECQGSGSTPYRVCLQLSDLGYKCTCPSRKFPCKHSLGLMLLLAKSPQTFTTATTPDWVMDWVARRRPGSSVEKKAEQSKPKASLDETLSTEPEQQRDEKSEARAVQQRERLKAQREEAILAGLDELDRWIEDTLTRGLASFMGEAAQRCRTLAQRLVDAKASTIATAVDVLPSAIMALPDVMRNDALIEALGELHLLAEAYRRQDRLPGALRQDVRRLVGWSQDRQSLIDDPASLRVLAQWTVVTTHVEVQPDKLRRIETWLIGVQDGKETPAVLIDFVPVATGASNVSFNVSESFVGELVFYPSAVPLRAVIVSRAAVELPTPKLPAAALCDALGSYDDLRTLLPWLKQWPMTLTYVSCKRFDKQGFWLMAEGAAIPVSPKLTDAVVALSGTELHTVTGLWDGRFFTPSMAETPIGRWFK